MTKRIQTHRWQDAVAIPVAILSLDLSPLALRLWCVLARFTNGQRVCWPSVRTLLRLLPPGTTERGVRRAKEELEMLTLLEQDPTFDKSGRQTSNTYRLGAPDEMFREEDEQDRGEGERMDRPGADGQDLPRTLSTKNLRTKELPVGTLVDFYRAIPGVQSSPKDGGVIAGLIGRHGETAVRQVIEAEAPALAAAESPLLFLASRFRRRVVLPDPPVKIRPAILAEPDGPIAPMPAEIREQMRKIVDGVKMP